MCLGCIYYRGGDKMDKKQFADLLKKGKVNTKRAPAGSADWKKILKKALKDGGVYTTTQFYEKFVKGKVNRGRTKYVLHRWCDEDKKIGRIWDSQLRSYVWLFDKELIDLYFKRVGAGEK
jgi:hypothetical protein